MKKYYTPAVYFISIVCGVIAYLISSFFSEPTVALLSGVLVTFIISLAITIAFVVSDAKYKPLKMGLPAPFVIDERFNYMMGSELRQGFMVLAGESLFLITFADKKPMRYEIKREQVKKISVTEGVYLNIFLDYDKFVRISSGNCLELSEKLTKQGFGV